LKISTHEAVMVEEVLDNLVYKENGNYVDCTFGVGGHSKKILDKLAENNIKAVFFCVGQNIIKYPNLVEKILEEGHTIGNHTMNHAVVTTLSKSERREEISSVSNLMKDNYSYDIKYFRPPHGRFNFGLAKELEQSGLKNVMWSLLTYDYKNKKDIVKFAITKYLEKNSIVVMHDSNKSKDVIIESIDFLIKYSLNNKLEFGKPLECLK
jgi:peptidoglycan/xylan/chitin deacetylase (PgdA/CDA1 family)